MSVKLEKEASRAVADKSKDDLVHKVGERLTGGKTKSGYLAVRLVEP